MLSSIKRKLLWFILLHVCCGKLQKSKEIKPKKTDKKKNVSKETQ